MATEEIREDKIGNIGREIVDGVPLGRTATAASTAPSPFPEEEQPKKNRPTQHIGCGIKTTDMASPLDYRALDCSGGLRQ